MDRQLFGVIAALLFAVVGVGGYDVIMHEQARNAPITVPALTAPAADTIANPAFVNTDGDDHEPDDDGDDDDWRAVQTQTAPATQPKASAPASTQAPGTYTLAQIATHNSSQSCYTAINGSVYDLTKWIYQHPGGAENILVICGKDGSVAYNAQHGGQRRPASELAIFKIGTLAP